MAELLQSNIFLTITGALIGAIISTIYFILGKNKKMLEYQVVSVNLITKDMKNIPGISIMLDGKPIEDLVATTIKFTNSGNQTIELKDFAALEPLGATVTGKFLNAEYSYQAKSDNPNSCPHIKNIEDNTVNIEFDFLKSKQSFTITLWHSGNLSVVGELKAGKIRTYTGIHKSLIFPLILFIFTSIAISILHFIEIDAYFYELDIIANSLIALLAVLLFQIIIETIKKFTKIHYNSTDNENNIEVE